MAPAAVQGLGRFAYALVLPSMRADLGWSYADAGLMNTANAAGYLLGALVAARIVGIVGVKRAMVIGIAATALMLAVTGLTRGFALLLALRFLAGILGAVTFVAGAALTAAAAGSAQRAVLAFGIYFAGGGLGVIGSALVVPPMLSRYGWGASWIALAALSILSLAVAAPALARAPYPARVPTGARQGAWPYATVLPLLASYCIYGAGYISYMTFIIAFLRNQQGFAGGEIVWFWLTLGVWSVIGGYFWGPILTRLPGARAVVLITCILAVGSVLPLLTDWRFFAYLSAAIFGCAFLSVVTAITSFARLVAPPHAWAAAIGLFTVMFAIGQCIGPVLTGFISDGVHGVRAGLWLSGGILVLAMSAAMLQRRPAVAAS